MTDPNTDPHADTALVDRIKAQAAEYGAYVAADDIMVGGALAYRAGDPVPVSNVERHKYLEAGMVVKTGTKAADAVSATRTPAPDADPPTPVDDPDAAGRDAAQAKLASIRKAR